MAVVATPGRTSGSAMRLNAVHRLAPSTIAASSSAGGRAAQNAFMIQIANGRLKDRYATTSPVVVPSRWVARKITNSGSTAAAIGAMRVEMIQNETWSLPLNELRAKP